MYRHTRGPMKDSPALLARQRSLQVASTCATSHCGHPLRCGLKVRGLGPGRFVADPIRGIVGSGPSHMVPVRMSRRPTCCRASSGAIDVSSGLASPWSGFVASGGDVNLRCLMVGVLLTLSVQALVRWMLKRQWAQLMVSRVEQWWQRITSGRFASALEETEEGEGQLSKKVVKVVKLPRSKHDPASSSASDHGVEGEGETVEWVNMCWRKAWRVYQRGLERWIIDLLQPVLDSVIKDNSVPRLLQRLRIVELTLDHEAPYFSNMRRRSSRKDSDLTGVVDLRYTGGAKMLLMLEVGEGRWRFKIPVLVSDLDLEAKVWVKIRLAPMCPWIGTISLAFVGPPNVKVQLSPYNRVRLMRIPVLQRFLGRLLTVDLPALMVLPKRLEISIPPAVTAVAEAAVGRDTIMRAVASAVLQADAVEQALIAALPLGPQTPAGGVTLPELFRGEVTVNLREARNLPVWGFPWQSNPYCVLTLGDQVAESRRDSDTGLPGRHRAPIWNQEFQFLVEDPGAQVLDIHVKDSHLTGRPDVGRVQFALKDLPPNGQVQLWLGLEPTNPGQSWEGELMLEITYKDFTDDDQDSGHREAEAFARALQQQTEKITDIRSAAAASSRAAVAASAAAAAIAMTKAAAARAATRAARAAKAAATGTIDAVLGSADDSALMVPRGGPSDSPLVQKGKPKEVLDVGRQEESVSESVTSRTESEESPDEQGVIEVVPVAVREPLVHSPNGHHSSGSRNGVLSHSQQDGGSGDHEVDRVPGLTSVEATSVVAANENGERVVVGVASVRGAPPANEVGSGLEVEPMDVVTIGRVQDQVREEDGVIGSTTTLTRTPTSVTISEHPVTVNVDRAHFTTTEGYGGSDKDELDFWAEVEKASSSALPTSKGDEPVAGVSSHVPASNGAHSMMEGSSVNPSLVEKEAAEGKQPSGRGVPASGKGDQSANEKNTASGVPGGSTDNPWWTGLLGWALRKNDQVKDGPASKEAAKELPDKMQSVNVMKTDKDVSGEEVMESRKPWWLLWQEWKWKNGKEVEGDESQKGDTAAVTETKREVEKSEKKKKDMAGKDDKEDSPWWEFWKAWGKKEEQTVEVVEKSERGEVPVGEVVIPHDLPLEEIAREVARLKEENWRSKEDHVQNLWMKAVERNDRSWLMLLCFLLAVAVGLLALVAYRLDQLPPLPMMWLIIAITRPPSDE